MRAIPKHFVVQFSSLCQTESVLPCNSEMSNCSLYVVPAKQGSKSSTSMSEESVFCSCSVPEAIQNSKRDRKPLIVFLKGGDESSEGVEGHFSCPDVLSVVKGSYVLRLEDDLSDMSDGHYKNAKMFRQFFPTDTLPTVMIIGQNGIVLGSVKGPMSLEEFKGKLDEALKLFNEQVKEADEQQAAAIQAAATSSTTPARTSQAQSTPVPIPNPTVKKTERSHPKDEQASVGKEATTKKSAKKNEAQKSPGKTENTERKLESPVKKQSKAPAKKKVEKVEEKKKTEPPQYKTAMLQFELTDGERIRAEFSSDATIREVCSYIDLHRTDGNVAYVLETMYPRQSFGPDMFGKTLKELDLVPRSTIKLRALGRGRDTAVESSGEGGFAEADGGLLGGIAKAISYVNPLSYFWNSGSAAPEETTQQRDHKDEPVPGDTAPENSGNEGGANWEYASKKPDSGGVRRRPGWGGNVHGLSEMQSAADDDPSKNSFWNGNSTQFGGHED